MRFIQEPGWRGAFTRDEADGALPNGTAIQKVKSEPGDFNPIGARGTVLGSLRAPSLGVAYFIEWETLPRCAVVVAAWKISAVQQEPRSGA